MKTWRKKWPTYQFTRKLVIRVSLFYAIYIFNGSVVGTWRFTKTRTMRCFEKTVFIFIGVTRNSWIWISGSRHARTFSSRVIRNFGGSCLACRDFHYTIAVRLPVDFHRLSAWWKRETIKRLEGSGGTEAGFVTLFLDGWIWRLGAQIERVFWLRLFGMVKD